MLKHDEEVLLQCDSCNHLFKRSKKTLVENVEFLNVHILDKIAGKTFDRTLLKGVEQHVRNEERLKKPNWFIWLIVGVIPYAFITLFAVLTMLGAK